MNEMAMSLGRRFISGTGFRIIAADKSDERPLANCEFWFVRTLHSMSRLSFGPSEYTPSDLTRPHVERPRKKPTVN